MRIRITFAKKELIRFTSHLDVYRAWERTLRRARLPLAYSQGYSPHPRLNLASALPLGFTGEAEILDVWLEEELPLEKIQAAILKSLPPGIECHQVEPIDERAATLQKELIASEYLITLGEPPPNLEVLIHDFLLKESIPRERRGKIYNLRPLVIELKLLKPESQGIARLVTTLTNRENATGRPEEIVCALGANPITARFHRIRLIFKDSGS